MSKHPAFACDVIPLLSKPARRRASPPGCSLPLTMMSRRPQLDGDVAGPSRGLFAWRALTRAELILATWCYGRYRSGDLCYHFLMKEEGK